MTDLTTEQLALFMNARDARDYGTAAWDALDLAGQEAYLTDAAAVVAAMGVLGWTPPGDPEATARVFEVEHDLRMRAHVLRNPEGGPTVAHEGHHVIENATYASRWIRRWCGTCDIEIEPREATDA